MDFELPARMGAHTLPQKEIKRKDFEIGVGRFRTNRVYNDLCSNGGRYD